MANRVLLAFLAFDMLFLLSAALLIAFPMIMKDRISQPPTQETVAENLLLERCPLTAAMVNAIIMFVTFLATIPALLMPTSRMWLKIHGYLVFICAMVSMAIGLVLWFDTLKTRTNLSTVWAAQAQEVQSLLQQKFKCCGYLSSSSPPFFQDSVCTNPLVAVQLSGCVGPFSSLANNFLDLIFTAAFGIVGIDVALILCIAMLLKDRKEKERYRHIDEKSGTAGF
ncbi:phospholipid scramblase 1 [Pseudogymnoascus destructans]|uniref:Phospholipid scramblase 1 n=2 Tax=Pseudogymnoascus destructans TaxID=655981 RepID=L8FUI3_PSED2|nr:phospholipid scramblase 1 [Pseudogymnoascus destructans]ELR04547.1 hypothetical protein GMDG_06838 [Pseudogymnoascus destructans 20631-21]OAF60839.1 phospholipid scramblase 1 [Pseudogymnoascus destructans]